MAYPCSTCRGFGQWWEWLTGAGMLRRVFARERPSTVPATAVHRICTDCMGGISSCCDGAVETDG